MPRIRPSKKSNPSVTGANNTAKATQAGLLESAEVVDIILDPSHPAFNPSQYRVIGSIQARAFPREFGISGDSCSWYNPLFPNLRQYPLLGEIVVLLAAAGRAAQLRSTATEKYYMSMPVGVWQGVNQNGLPAASYNINKAGGDDKNYRTFTGNAKGDVNDLPFGETFVPDSIARIFPYEGDTILEGRFGQSLRFGSTVSEPKTENDWSKDGIDGDPITILSTGHSTTDSGYHIESINEDSAGIWMMSGQSIPIDVASKLADSYGQAYESAKEAEREAVAGPDAAEIPTGGGASSGGNAEAQPAAGGGGAENGEDDQGPVSETEVAADEDIQEAVEELQEAGEYDAYRRGKFTETITCVVIDGKIVNKAFADKILTVKQAATKDGITIKVNSGFRPMESYSGQGFGGDGQMTLRRRNADKKYAGTKSGLNKPAGTNDDGWSDQIRQTDYFNPLTAGPGHSNHQNGKAFDINTDMGKRWGHPKRDPDFKGYKETSKTWRWIVANMHQYGFIRTVAKERWHWEYQPGQGMFSRVPRSHPTWDFLT
tara:strand:- start:596 stop:2224 length:1629 start_codon:yes stop_codon:yes gene_type:complete